MTDHTNKHKKAVLLKVGTGLIVIAILLYISTLIIPFLPMQPPQKVGLVAGALIAGEVFFWFGALFVGKEVVAKVRSRFNPKNWKNKPALDEKLKNEK